ncbi:MAG: electron transport complex subunit E [Magnetococcales bacterium]|nr:electron transport complex subunit E [Magnetococcales bacterium]
MSAKEPEISQIFADGVWNNNVIFAQLLGMCPLLGVTTNAKNGVGMGMATLMVLLGSNILISMVRNYIPSSVRIPSYIVIIASLVTIVDLSMNAFAHDMHKVLGLFIPLIVVNCCILGRAEAFASKSGIFHSAVDAIGMGLGFTLALVLLGGTRELLGSGRIWDIDIFGASYHPAIAFILPPGAFIALGFILVGIRWLEKQRKAKVAAAGTTPVHTQSEAACHA